MKKMNKAPIALVNSPLIEETYHHPLFPPLGLAYLAAVLEQNNFDVKIIDCPACKMDHEKLRAELSSLKPALVGIASMTPTIPSALKSARIAKEACPDAKVVMGGPHATFADAEILTEEPAVDIIVRGEGELTLLELAQNLPELRNLGRIKGITFKHENQIVKTPDRPFIENLDELPRPSYKSIPIDRYRICGKKFLPIMSSRGCPFQCAFCVASQMFGAEFRTRSPKNVVDEMEWLINTYGAEGISFHDDTLTLDKKRMFDICDEIISRKLKIAWGCQTRVDQVSKEVLAKMRRAGCNEVSFGVESGCQRILDAVKKKVSTDQSARAVRIAKDEGLFVAVSTIIGYPGETKESLKQTLDFIHTLEPDDVWLCLATPYPGTELRALIERMGWKMVTDWTLYNTMNPIFENPDLPSEEISRMRKQFYDKFYSPRYVLRQMIKGSVKGNFYSKIMARTSANYLLWRIKSRM
ncbi:MAG: B12-binding domain-containing radical SAM protein [Candidatus Bathyarchaeota archaeon]|nr:B12-binding domain-containing radical SAM protein [Candidatus Bathyarchaeota archaeon]